MPACSVLGALQGFDIYHKSDRETERKCLFYPALFGQDFLWESSVTDIQNACMRFNNLLHFEYEIRLAKKKTMVTICLHFQKKDFHHLAGLHYLKDRPELRSDRAKIFEKILSDEVFAGRIQKSDNYTKIKGRVFYLSKLEDILDSNETVFKYNQNEAVFSRIDADFLLKNSKYEKNIFTFIKNEQSGKYICNSFFPEDNYDYSKNQILWKVISKKKKDLRTGKEYSLM